ncbi:MAG: 50S ribosomal protein L29 [Nitrospinaceae bacterium]|jgi:large subunit ribosomal protein L29|nr:50S ribosomal protein L29 [Nitrospinaceae bacterium]MDP6656964.1 50S ribosomal protein L29 [Nitrospinaceae bacterium]MDP6711717.1 50S ribosomal protein L29 [Nitrospinaceae bacterium]MDP7057026.1 50S ribosomal protein L29 [Nitrospinaceae bacterium]HAK37118.1 50S ribosomal protein L29 [Nitrospina sp.]|tara:strand:+ start:2007 stop:2243 length:237 start_codon:yes stop_codon:yes gene_type:complete
MKAQDIRELTEKERQEKVDDLSQEFFNLKFQLATGKIENPSRLRFIRRDIARLKTILGESAGRGAKPAESTKESADKA